MYLILNDKKIKIKNAITLKERFLGFMGISPIDYGMLFPSCNAIHTFFMKENIDIIGLNEKNEVIYIYRNLPKNQIINIKNSIKKTSVLELPKNTSKEIQMGETLIFKDKDII